MEPEKLEEIKKAFYKTFSGAGELWFDYNTEYSEPQKTQEELDSYVDEYWEEFIEHLQTLTTK